MSGPDGLKVPPAGQGTGLGTKKFEDLIESDVKLEIKGTNARATGSLKNVTGWTEFSQTDNSGHFLPIQLPAVCQDRDVTVKGRKAGDRVIHPTAEDMILITRLENLSGTVFSLEIESKTILTVDVGELKLRPYVGKDAIRLANDTDTDLDWVKPSELMNDDVRIEWTGIKGKVTGTAKKYDMPPEHFSGVEGHFAVVVIEGHDGEEVTATGSSGDTAKLTDPIWVIQTDKFKSGGKNAKLEAGGVTLCELDFADITQEE